MIPAEENYIAVYRMPDKSIRMTQIIAWDDDGNPLIVGARKLLPATLSPNYLGILKPGSGPEGVKDLCAKAKTDRERGDEAADKIAADAEAWKKDRNE